MRHDLWTEPWFDLDWTLEKCQNCTSSFHWKYKILQLQPPVVGTILFKTNIFFKWKRGLCRHMPIIIQVCIGYVGVAINLVHFLTCFVGQISILTFLCLSFNKLPGCETSCLFGNIWDWTYFVQWPGANYFFSASQMLLWLTTEWDFEEMASFFSRCFWCNVVLWHGWSGKCCKELCMKPCTLASVRLLFYLQKKENKAETLSVWPVSKAG